MAKEEKILGYLGDSDGEESSRLYVYKNVHGNYGDVEIFRKRQPYFNYVGEIVIKYNTFVFPGMTIEEFRESEYREGMKFLEATGHIIRNDMGTPFWKEDLK
jgi:hypothetical protein